MHSLLIEGIKLDSSYSPLFTLLGIFYEKIESDFTRAIKCFVKSISTNPKDEEAIRHLYEIYISQKKINEAIPLISRLLEADQRSFWGWNQLGIINLVFQIKLGNRENK